MRKIFLALTFLMSFIFVNQVSAAVKDTPQWIKNIPAAKDAENKFLSSRESIKRLHIFPCTKKILREIGK